MLPRRMRALYTSRYGDPDVLEVRERPTPTPGHGEALVRVERAGLNFADVMARMGLYPDAPKAPMVVGYEIAGVVEALGPGVHGPPVGTRVLALVRFNGQASHVLVPEQQLLLMPAKMSFDEGAALPVNYLTAFHMLFFVGHLKPFDKVLLHSAAGGVGLAVIQLCQLGEGVTIIGTASAPKHALLKSLGVAHCIDYRTQDFEAEVKRLTDGRGVNLALDPLGGASWGKSYRCLRTTGQLICFGWSAMSGGEKRSVLRIATQAVQMRWWNPVMLMSSNKTVSGVNLGHMWGELELMRRQLQQLLKLYNEGKIKPHVDRVFPLSEGPAAHRYLQERRNIGKVIFDCTR